MLLRFKQDNINEDGVITISGYASTNDEDRVGDVVAADAWKQEKALADYKKNPIILAYHNHQMPIGKAVSLEPDDRGLKITAEISPADKKVYDLIKDGVLSTFSIGFRINDAEYKEEADIFLIKEVELREISVVSIPCNQDCLFEVSKAYSEDEVKALKSKFTTTKQENVMDEKQLQALYAELAAIKSASQGPDTADIVKSIMAQLAAAEAEKAEKAAAEAAAEAEKAAAVAAATTAAEDKAAALVAAFEAKMAEKDSTLADTMKAFQDDIKAQAEEITRLTASRDNKMPIGSTNYEASKALDAEGESMVLLGIATKKSMFGTKAGAEFKEKAASSLPAGVNTSGSAEVSSSTYEALFRTNLERDIQDNLVIQPLFQTVAMNAANMVLPIAANAAQAGWVNASTYGTSATIGSEITQAISEINLRTYKLAAHSFLPDELEEDTILPMLPLIRRYLVEAMAYAVDDSVLNSDATTGGYAGIFRGLLNLAAQGTNKVAATAAGKQTKVTAAMITEKRRLMGKRGRRASDFFAIISQDAYFDLLDDPEFKDANLVGGTTATKLNGEMSSISGIRLIVSDAFPTPGDNVPFCALVDATNFLIPTQRGLTVETDRIVGQQNYLLVATQRMGFNQIIDGEGVVAITYSQSYNGS